MWFCYIIECSDGTLYTGITNDLEKRISTHNSGKGAKYTKTRLPVVLKWSTQCENKSEASKLEWKIKQLPRSKKLSLFIENK
jgi:putative endonuclease